MSATTFARCDWCGHDRDCEPARAGTGHLWICTACADERVPPDAFARLRVAAKTVRDEHQRGHVTEYAWDDLNGALIQLERDGHA